MSYQGDLYSLIQKKKKEVGEIPEYTCPEIDKAKEMLETLRLENARLREIGIEWYEFSETLSDKADEIIKDLEKEIEEQKSEINDLKYQINHN
ncbi:MAG: hypothetical protein WC755_08820 [Candidatus Woesearchaeota archaeon]